MKATGIVRRMDDLGRVVIPKEIRRVLHLRDGDPLEIYTDRDGEVIFKKYSPMGDMTRLAEELCQTLGHFSDMGCAVSDRDTLIAVSGQGKKELAEKPVSGQLASVLSARRPYVRKAGEYTPLTEDTKQFCVTVAVPILTAGDIMGCVMFYTEKDCIPGEAEQKLAQSAAVFLGKHLED